MKQHWPRLLGAGLFLSGCVGCATTWEEITSHERDWSYVFNFKRPKPLEVIANSTDGARRAQAYSELKEPLANGGTAEDQAMHLRILGTAAKEDREPLCRLTAIRTLGKFKDPAAARLLEEVHQQQKMPFTQELNALMRKEALVALESTRDPQAGDFLVRIARLPGPAAISSLSDSHQTQDEKTVAVRALRNYRNQKSVDALAYVLKSEKDIALRHVALKSLEEVTGKEWPESYAAWQQQELNPQPVEAREPSAIQRVTGFVIQK